MAAIQEDNRPQDSTGHGTVARSAFKVTAGAVLSLVGSLGSQVLIAAIFGTGLEVDAFLTALVIPTYLWAVLAGGLPLVIVPAFVEKQSAGKEEAAWSLVGTFVWLTTGVLLLVAVVSSIFSREIIRAIAPGLSEYKTTLAADMLAIAVFTVPMIGLTGLTQGIENARDSFFWPALAPGIGAIGNILVLVFLHQAFGSLALALGYLVSELLRASVTLIPICRHGWRRLLPLNEPSVRRSLRLLLPLVTFGMLINALPLWERFYASALPDGDLSYIGYAYKISKVVQMLFGESLLIAIYPVMSRTYSSDGVSSLKSITSHVLRLTMAISIPALAVFSGMAVPLVSLFFQRGAFTTQATLSVSRLIPIVILGDVLLRTTVNVLERVFYVTEDTRTVSAITAAMMVLYAFYANPLSRTYGYVGLTLALPLQSLLRVLMLSVLLYRRKTLPNMRPLVKAFITYALSGGVLFVICKGIVTLVARWPSILQVGISGVTCAALYLAFLWYIDRPMAVAALEMTGIWRIGKWIGLRMARSSAPQATE